MVNVNWFLPLIIVSIKASSKFLLGLNLYLIQLSSISTSNTPKPKSSSTFVSPANSACSTASLAIHATLSKSLFIDNWFMVVSLDKSSLTSTRIY